MVEMCLTICDSLHLFLSDIKQNQSEFFDDFPDFGEELTNLAYNVTYLDRQINEFKRTFQDWFDISNLMIDYVSNANESHKYHCWCHC